MEQEEEAAALPRNATWTLGRRRFLALSHLLKAGGTQAEILIRSVLFADPGYSLLTYFFGPDHHSGAELRSARARYRRDFPFPRARDTRREFFTVGVGRNPCAYLVSMWAFQSNCNYQGRGRCGHAGAASSSLQCFRQLNFTGPTAQVLLQEGLSSAENIERFQRWVRVTAGVHRIHYYSYRSYLAMHTEDVHHPNSSWDDGQFYACLGTLSPATEKHIAESLDVHERFDCFAYVETLGEDLRTCLELYAAQLAKPAERDYVLRRLQQRSHDFTKTRKANGSPHDTCERYFDQKTHDFVWEREGAFAQRLGYRGCCSPREP